MQQKIRWGILGTGRIAQTFAAALQRSAHNELIAIGSRTEAQANRFAEHFAEVADRCYPNYTALLADPAVDAVYVSTPHPQHASWTVRALQAGKAVLCEKPLALNHAQAMAMVETARREGRFLMEAFMYRLHPQFQRVAQLIAAGAIGEVRHIEASFGYHAPFDAASRLYANALGGGGILDVGCYPLSFARAIAGSEPLTVAAHGHLGASGVDEWSAAMLTFDNGLSAHLSTAVALDLPNTATVFGSRGRIHLPQPWLPADAQGGWSFELHQDGKVETVAGSALPLYVLEADHVAALMRDGALESPLLPWQDTLNQALALDQWRAAIGLTYAEEQPGFHPGPLLGSLTPRQPPMSQGQVQHLDKHVSRLVMGCDNQPSLSHASIMWDDFVEMGGNCFDTAHIYGGGSMETLLGYWHTQRQMREEIVIIGKGAHTPDNFPACIAPQLTISLERLQTDYVDLYFLHRDNLDVPVEEFIDALNQEVRSGRIRAFGGSNWTLARVQAANAYAQANGLQGFSALSNNFSLAQMREPIWPGTESCTAADYRAYLTESQLAVFPWSSQARGFFTPWAQQVRDAMARENLEVTRMQPTIEELQRVWFSPENFARRDAAQALAEQYQTDLINIALAYVLCQPFPTFPLVGPRVMAETFSCMTSLQIPLTPADMARLELRSA